MRAILGNARLTTEKVTVKKEKEEKKKETKNTKKPKSHFLFSMIYPSTLP